MRRRTSFDCDDYCNKRCVVEQNENGEWNAAIIQKSELEESENEQMKKEDENVLEQEKKDKDKDV